MVKTMSGEEYTGEYVLCLFQNGPMHDTMMQMPADVQVVAMSEPMELVWGDEDADDVIYIEQVYRNAGRQAAGHVLLMYEPGTKMSH